VSVGHPARWQLATAEPEAALVQPGCVMQPREAM
jgi:hypothetical protein